MRVTPLCKEKQNQNNLLPPPTAIHPAAQTGAQYLSPAEKSVPPFARDIQEDTSYTRAHAHTKHIPEAVANTKQYSLYIAADENSDPKARVQRIQLPAVNSTYVAAANCDYVQVIQTWLLYSGGTPPNMVRVHNDIHDRLYVLSLSIYSTLQYFAVQRITCSHFSPFPTLPPPLHTFSLNQ